MDVPIALPMAQKKGDSLHYEVDLPRNGETAYVLIASYDADGRFVGMDRQEVPCFGPYENTIEVDESLGEYRLFQTDVLGSPMGEPWTNWDYWIGLE